MTNDSFVRGQWLKKGKIITSECFLSYDASYFRYKLKLWDHDEPWPNIYDMVSKPPYFTPVQVSGWSYSVKPRGENIKTHWVCSKVLPDGYEVENGSKLKKNGQVILDVTNDNFVQIVAPYQKC